MPQVIVRYDSKLIPQDELYGRNPIGSACRRLIAEAASTDEVPFTIHDIEWITQPHGPGSIAPQIAIEIRTIGYPERKAKLNKERLEELKKDMLAAGLEKYTASEAPLIWVQFIDAEGAHV